MEKEKGELKIGKRVLYHVYGNPDILEGVISNVSPSGKLFKIEQTWYNEGSFFKHGDPITAEILDELPSIDRR